MLSLPVLLEAFIWLVPNMTNFTFEGLNFWFSLLFFLLRVFLPSMKPKHLYGYKFLRANIALVIKSSMFQLFVGLPLRPSLWMHFTNMLIQVLLPGITPVTIRTLMEIIISRANLIIDPLLMMAAWCITTDVSSIDQRLWSQSNFCPS